MEAQAQELRVSAARGSPLEWSKEVKTSVSAKMQPMTWVFEELGFAQGEAMFSFPMGHG